MESRSETYRSFPNTTRNSVPCGVRMRKPFKLDWFLPIATICLLALWIVWFATWKTISVIGLITTFYPPNVALSLRAIAAVGFLAMCLIQAIRFLIPVRSWFHQNKLRLWLSSSTETDQEPGHSPGQELGATSSKDADFEQILNLTNTKDPTAFFEMPIEQVCGQLSAVAELILSQPQTYKTLIVAFAGSGASKDAKKLIQMPSAPLQTQSDDVRDRVAYAIQRNIDAFQIAAGNSWRRCMRLAAIIVSAAIAYGAVSRRPEIRAWDVFMTALSVGLVAGFLASVFRDIVAIIERLRRA